MLLCPPARKTSPTRTSDSVMDSFALSAIVSVCAVADTANGCENVVSQKPSAPVVAIAVCPANETVTVRPAASLPHTVIGLPRWRTMWSCQ